MSVSLLAFSLVLATSLGRAFLPDFNEGALSLSAVTLPGTSLETSDKLGRKVEETLLSFPEVVSTARRTGRAELDEHAQGVNASEIDARLEIYSIQEMLEAEKNWAKVKLNYGWLSLCSLNDFMRVTDTAVNISVWSP